MRSPKRGASYYGFTQWSAAMLRPPHLKAIDRLRDGGYLELPLGSLCSLNELGIGGFLAKQLHVGPGALSRALRVNHAEVAVPWFNIGGLYDSFILNRRHGLCNGDLQVQRRQVKPHRPLFNLRNVHQIIDQSADPYRSWTMRWYRTRSVVSVINPSARACV